MLLCFMLQVLSKDVYAKQLCYYKVVFPEKEKQQRNPVPIKMHKTKGLTLNNLQQEKDLKLQCQKS